MKQNKTKPNFIFPYQIYSTTDGSSFLPDGQRFGGQVHLIQQCFLLDEQFDQYIENKKQAEQFEHWVTWHNETEEAPKSDLRLHCLALKYLA